MAEVYATSKQVFFAMQLLAKKGYSTRYMNSSFKELGATMRQRSGMTISAWLQGMTRAEISALIDSLK